MQKSNLTTLLLVCLLAGSSYQALGAPTAEEVAGYEDISDRSKKTFNPGQVYRISTSGICGKVMDDHFLVTHVIPGSVADGKVMKGDRIRALQYRSVTARGGVVPSIQIRVYRLGRDWDWHFYVTVERPSLRDGKGNTVTFDLRVPPTPGNLCHYGPTGFFAKRHTDRLVVDMVEEGSPSDGKLKKGDVIVAVEGKPITVDAYEQFTEAVDKAESQAGKGKLKLTVRKRAPNETGATTDDAAKDEGEENSDKDVVSLLPPATVTLNLQIYGSYSDTAPVNCEKTDALITQTADHLVKNKRFGTLGWGLLGLLATGEEKYINVVREYLHAAKWAQPPEDVKEILTAGGYVSWYWGYRNLIMAEYYLLTGDEFVLPAITQLSRTLAAGQDPAGLWGHRMAHPELGRAYGYGVMNQPSLSIFISLILAEKCGVKDTIVHEAIQRTHNHYDNWVGQGALPYGNHGPMEHLFTNNGTSGSLAVAFALLGNKKGADFYAAMSAAASEEILTGHSGPSWNILWSGLGANVLGPEMAGAYNRKIHWLRTVTRAWDGRYVGLLGWGSKPKPGRLSSTGSQLLNLCTGRRAICITGKGMDTSLWVPKKKADKIIEAGTIDTSNDDVLLQQLGSRFPPVRLRAANQLAVRDADVAAEVLSMLSTGTVDQQIGAMHAIDALKITGVADKLLAIAKDEGANLWVRQHAVKRLGEMPKAKAYVRDLLELLVADKPYDQPYREFDASLGAALASLMTPDPYTMDIDKDLFYEGVGRLLDHKHGWTRKSGMTLLKNIPIEDLPRIIDKMVHVIENKDPTYTFYGDHGRQAGLETLYRLGIKESMNLTVNTIKEPTGRAGPRMRKRMRLLKTFGAEAKYLIRRIKEVLGKRAEPIVERIEASENPRKMVTIEELKKSASQ